MAELGPAQPQLVFKTNFNLYSSIQGVLEHCDNPETSANQRALVHKRCQELLAAGCDSPYLLGFMVELIQQQLENDPTSDTSSLASSATSLCSRLSLEVDTVRCKYWNFISDTISRKYMASA